MDAHARLRAARCKVGSTDRRTVLGLKCGNTKGVVCARAARVCACRSRVRSRTRLRSCDARPFVDRARSAVRDRNARSAVSVDLHGGARGSAARGRLALQPSRPVRLRAEAESCGGSARGLPVVLSRKRAPADSHQCGRSPSNSSEQRECSSVATALRSYVVLYRRFLR